MCTGKAKGGFARAAALTEEQRKEISAKGTIARWGLRATHKGNFKKDFGIDVDCYVLNDSTKTAVISQRGMATALGISKVSSATKITDLLQRKTINQYLGPELCQKLENPLIFQYGKVGLKSGSKPQINGYDVTILIDICVAIIQAKNNGELTSRQDRLVEHAQTIINASAKVGIKSLVYALSGYSPEVQAVIAEFKRFVLEEAKKYEKEFPNELYAQWQRLYNIQPPQKGKNWKEMHLTIDHVYIPLAKSNGHLLDLLRSAKEDKGARNTKLFQFLNEVGAKALRVQIGKVLGIAEISPDRSAYEKNISKMRGDPVQISLFQDYPIVTD